MQNFNLQCYQKIGVYSIENKISGKCYIGSTTMSFEKRWNHHRSLLRAGNHKNTHLQKSWDKHGEEVFMFKVLEITCENNSLSREQQYLDNIDNKYNINPLATGTPNLSQETIDKRAKTFSKFIKKAIEYYYKVKNENYLLEDVPEKYKLTVMGRLGSTVWNKGLTKEDTDYSYLKVPKTITKKVLDSRAERVERLREETDNILVYDINMVFLKKFRCPQDIEEWSLTDENDLPIISRFKKERMGKPLKWLSSISIVKSCNHGNPYKGLYFKREVS